MPEAKLSLSVPADTWVHDVSTAHPGSTFRVLAALAGEESGIGLVELETPDPLAVLTDLQGREDVAEVDLLWQRETEALLQVETSSPTLLVPVWRAGVPIELPFTIQDGAATWELTTSATRFAEFGRQLDAVGIDYEVESVRGIEEDGADRIVTDRQREVLEAARDLGYYATPREATLTAVADSLDISKATCSDILHRAEGSVVDWFAAEHPA